MTGGRLPTLQSVEVTGFKNYQSTQSFGPFADFNCVIGCNASGKSALGEAIAFVLGASPKALRANDRASLVNQAVQAAAGLCKVEISFRLQDASGSESQLSVMRQLRAKQSTVQIMLPGSNQWQLVSEAALADAMAAHGLPHQNIQRSIIMQHQKAADVHDPLMLCSRLEALIGSAAIEEEIIRISADLARIEGGLQDHAATRQSLQEQRLQLAPAVRAWQDYEEQNAQFLTRKRAFLLEYAEHLQTQEEANADEAKSLEAAATAAEQQQQHQHKILSKAVKESRRKEADLSSHCSSLAAARDQSARKVNAKQTSRSRKLQEEDACLQDQSIKLRSQIEQIKSRNEASAQEQQEAERKLRQALQAMPAHVSTLKEDLEQAKQALQARQAAHAKVHLAMEGAQEKHAAMQQGLHELEQALEKTEGQESAHGLHPLEQQAMTSEQREQQALQSLQSLQQKLQAQQADLSAAREQQAKSTQKNHRIQKAARVDAAVADLMHMQNTQDLPGRLYGRICDLAVINQDEVITAVNAVLADSCNLASTLVVGQYETASAVISHFRTHKSGLVRCLITTEMATIMARRQQQRPPGAGTPSNLMQFLDIPQSLADVRPVLEHLLSSWWFVPTREDATRVLTDRRHAESGRGANFVTKQGELFKSNAEVLSQSASSSSMQAYHMRAGSSCIGPADHQAAHGRPQLEAMTSLKALESEHAHLQGQAAQAEAEYRQLTSQRASAQHQLKAAEAHFYQQQRAQRQEVDSLHSRIKAAIQSIELAQQEIDILRSQAAALDVESFQHVAASAQHSYSEAIKQTPDGQQAVNLHKQCSALQATIDAYEAELKDLQGQLTKADLRLAQLQRLLKQVDTGRAASALQQAHSQADSTASKLREAQDKEAKASQDPGEPSASVRATRSKSKRPSARSSEAWTRAVRKLALDEEALQRERDAVDTAALQADAEAQSALTAILQDMHQKQLESERLQGKKRSLEQERYTSFCTGMAAINHHLASIYAFLTNKQGTATCSFTEDSTLLFLDGVTLQCRPDQHRWRPFSSLSGGQQALATLALSFALQAAFPAGFYFFDEIDAALDAATAARVGNYIRLQTNAQYLVVSHRPEFYEQASSLIGIYSYGGQSNAVTVQFPHIS
ncbi:hypothetical protein WJX73_004428 [Symbiochloris irregularis]|uniref:Structural maintenance of chromosomes protein n=1 Tax=Symbiochloris irregularis TaxID=706552 RepID=A0AAW1NX99_9CHLO